MASEIYDNSFTNDIEKLNISSEAEVFVFLGIICPAALVVSRPIRTGKPFL